MKKKIEKKVTEKWKIYKGRNNKEQKRGIKSEICIYSFTAKLFILNVPPGGSRLEERISNESRNSAFY